MVWLTAVIGDADYWNGYRPDKAVRLAQIEVNSSGQMAGLAYIQGWPWQQFVLCCCLGIVMAQMCADVHKNDELDKCKCQQLGMITQS